MYVKTILISLFIQSDLVKEGMDDADAPSLGGFKAMEGASILSLTSLGI